MAPAQEIGHFTRRFCDSYLMLMARLREGRANSSGCHKTHPAAKRNRPPLKLTQRCRRTDQATPAGAAHRRPAGRSAFYTRDLKYGVGLNHLPSGRFPANLRSRRLSPLFPTGNEPDRFHALGCPVNARQSWLPERRVRGRHHRAWVPTSRRTHPHLLEPGLACSPSLAHQPLCQRQRTSLL